jgi:hypothetical protein
MSEGDRKRVVTVAEAIVVKLIQAAINGDHRARSTILALQQQAAQDGATSEHDQVATPEEMAMVESAIKREARKIANENDLASGNKEEGAND